MTDIEKNRRLTDKCSIELGLLQKRAAEVTRNLAQELLSSVETGIESAEVERLRFERAQVEQRIADLLIVLRELKRQRKRLKAEQEEGRFIAALV